MKKFCLSLLFLALLCGCAVVPRRVEILQWPEQIVDLQGEGRLDLKWNGQNLSASFALSMHYPDRLLLEAYGSPFGQTILHLQKDDDKFLLIAGNEKFTKEDLLRERYGFGVDQLMDGLAMKGNKQGGPGGPVSVQHEDYRVAYGQDRRDRRTMCWERDDARLCLTFTDISFGKP
jgi:outer membrane biogenesis lipoprotein LolB